MNRFELRLDDLFERPALVDAPLNCIVELELLFDLAKECVHAREHVCVRDSERSNLQSNRAAVVEQITYLLTKLADMQAIVDENDVGVLDLERSNGHLNLLSLAWRPTSSRVA